MAYAENKNYQFPDWRADFYTAKTFQPHRRYDSTGDAKVQAGRK